MTLPYRAAVAQAPRAACRLTGRADNDDMTVTPSRDGYAQTSRRLLEAIQKRGLRVFARIDHAGAARDAGLELPEEEVFVFGSAKAGTPLMRDDPRIGIELPLRMLIWREGSATMLGYNDPRELLDRYSVAEHARTLDDMRALLTALASEAAG
jgi:uncharacterized protein (DUF302 family)